VIYGDASNSVAGAFGNNANAIDIGFAQVLSTSQATLLTNGARTVGKAINIGNGLSSISDYAVTLGGETADTSTFSGNIDLDGSVARTTKVALTAASGGTVNFSGLLSHGTSGSAVPIEKIGLGTVNLSRAAGNTYTGNTTVSVGTLLVNNTAGSGTGTGSVAVNSGGTLGGNGTISGAVTVNSGGTLSPGNSPGLLTQGATTLEGGGNYNWQIADALGLAGTGYDSISLTSGSALTLNNTSVSKFNINLWSLSGISPDVNGDANFFNNSSNYSWTLIATDQVIGGFAADKFAINITATNGAEGFANTLNGSFSVALADGGTDLNLVYTAVPEPSTWALLAGSLTVVTILRRRRR
jgi:autotransporter-associated beta strand protein